MFKVFYSMIEQCAGYSDRESYRSTLLYSRIENLAEAIKCEWFSHIQSQRSGRVLR